MNRDQYLDAIRKALQEANMDSELSKEILYDYEEHFEIGLQKGKTQEQLCEELGSIEEILQEIGSMKQNSEIEGSRVKSTETGNLARDLGSSVPSNNMNNDIMKGIDPNETQVLDMDAACETVRQEDSGTDYQASNGKPDFTRVEIEGPCVDVYVSKGDCFKVDYENSGNAKAKLMYQFYHYQKDGVLYCGVKENYTKTFFRIIRNVDISLYIQIPSFIDELNIKLASGDMEVRDQKLRRLSLHSASGDIELSNSAMTECFCNSCSGDISIHSCNMDVLNAKTSSGDVEINSGTIKVLNANSASGDVSCSSITKEYYLKSISGDVEVTSFGDIRGSFESVSGDAEVRLNNDGNGYKVSLSTVSGDIDINYRGVNERECSKGIYTFGNQGSEFQVRTVSGDVQLRG
ncbi:MAG TPA: DUF4097 family beta strand repeat-containing protein [Lachnospiraceae bacterium]|nr:DUF4097 family beta strand repeat-containing protein [Lachnospiraceae bacterium]